MAFGVGTATESAGDIALNLETSRSPLNLTSYDFVENRLVYKATVPDEYVGKIYEVGLYSLEASPLSGEFGSRNISTFDSETEVWADPADGTVTPFSTTNTRIGSDSLRHSHAASTTLTSALRELTIDLSGYSAADSFTIAYNVGTANTSQLSVRFMTDASNYYYYNLGSQTTGYKIVSVNKGSALVQGAPSWSEITEIRVVTTSGATGATTIDFEAIRVEDRDSQNLDYILVARKVLPIPVTKVSGMALEVEFYLDVNI